MPERATKAARDHLRSHRHGCGGTHRAARLVPVAAPAEVRAEAMACLPRVRHFDRAMARADSLSGGQRQRMAIQRSAKPRGR